MTPPALKSRRSAGRSANWFTAAEISQVVNQTWGSQVCTDADVSSTWTALESALREQELLTWGCVIGCLSAIGVLAPGFRPSREMGNDAALAARYTDRPELGNSRAGDASRYRARGIYPIVGRAAYRQYGRRLDFPLERQPELALEPEVAVAIMLTVFIDRGLPRLASQGDWDSIRGLTSSSSRDWTTFMVIVRRLEAIAAHRETDSKTRLKPGQIVREPTSAVHDDADQETAQRMKIFAPEGTPIYSPVEGSSSPALERDGGFVTSIVGQDGREYRLCHGSTPFISGDIAQGQLIGRVGSTGTGPGGFASAGGVPAHVEYTITESPPRGGVTYKHAKPDPDARATGKPRASQRGRRS